MIPWLFDNNIEFPSTNNAMNEPNGLLAAGGDLSTDRLIAAYKLGIFPWYSDDDPILWWSPSPRCIVTPEDLHVSTSMKKFIRKTKFRVTFDQAFEKVITQCSAPRNHTDGTWITDEMNEAYCQLHKLGFAHSVETWENQNLIGGLYGIAIGKVFFGESMFSRKNNASKLAFITLTEHLAQADFKLIDCQVSSKHLFSLGAKEVDRETFEAALQQAIKEKPDSAVFHMPESARLNI